MEQNSGASLPTCRALTSRREGPSAHLQRHKQAGDGGAHMAPADPAGWGLVVPWAVNLLGEDRDFDSPSPWGRECAGGLWAVEYEGSRAEVAQMCAGISVVCGRGRISLLG